MTLNIQNAKGETIGTIDLKDDVFGGRVKTDLIWASVVQENAAKRRGTRDEEPRDRQRRRQPYKQKGYGRPRVRAAPRCGRKGGTVFGPQPRSYEFDMPKKVRVGAVRAARAEAQRRRRHHRRQTRDCRRQDERHRRDVSPPGVSGKALVIDVKPDEKFVLTARNIAGVSLTSAARVTARDIMDTSHVIATREAIEKLQESLA